jgi:hypothetical protein
MIDLKNIDVAAPKQSSSQAAMLRILAMALPACLALTSPSVAEVLVRGGKEAKPLHELREAPASIKPDIPLVIGQPSPSEVDPHLLGPVLFMKSAHVDLEAGTATLPLRRGKLGGKTAWFVITDTDSKELADAMGVNFSSKLGFADGNAVRSATLEADGSFAFEKGAVDFTPEWSITPGDAPNFYPPKKFQPGSVGDANYSPLVRTSNGGGHIFNAPMVAFGVTDQELNKYCDGSVDKKVVHDHVVKICPRDGTVTMELTLAFTFSKPLYYLSTDSNDPLVATLEKSTVAPGLKDVRYKLEDVEPGSGAERIVAVINGPEGKENPQRQGLNSALSAPDARGPLNIAGGVPTINLDYSPIWDLMPVKWSDEAIQKGYRSRITDLGQLYGLEAGGWLTGPEGGPIESSGFGINCPVVYRIN